LRDLITFRQSIDQYTVHGILHYVYNNFPEMKEKSEIRAKYKEALMGIMEKIKELEKNIELTRQEERAVIVTADVGEFAKGRIYPNIKVEKGELRVRVEDGYHSIVRAGKFNELVNEVRDRLLKQGFVVIVGPKGIGKSTLAAAAVWELLSNYEVGLVARVDVLGKELLGVCHVH